MAAHKRTRGTYGSERLHRELLASGCVVSLWKVKQLRRELGLVCKRKRRFIRTTESNHALPVAPNLLNRDFTPGELTNPGTLLALERIPKIVRLITVRQNFDYVIKI